jgi:hypothetical protein
MRQAAIGLILILVAGSASATQAAPIKVWDIAFGTHVSDLPETEFVDPACGGNGGAPGLRIPSFEDFMRCRPEASGLREVAFIYDDEMEAIANARRDGMMLAAEAANRILGQPVTLSLLIDQTGHLQGYRIFTDPRAPEEQRLEAYAIATVFRARFGSSSGWNCIDTPPEEGQTPILQVFINRRCLKVAAGKQIVVENRHYFRKGEALFDPHSARQTRNAFESSARLEVIADAYR